MFSPRKNVLFCILYYYIASVLNAPTYEKVTFFAVEHPAVLSINTKHITFANISSRRYSRSDPIYYFSLRWINVFPIGNDYTFHFYFYQFLTNVYKPSFVELHITTCRLVKDPIFGVEIVRAMKKIEPKGTCPLPPGDWNIQNCTLMASALPNFPFSKGRIYANITHDPSGDLAASGYIDFQIKEMKIKVKKN